MQNTFKALSIREQGDVNAAQVVELSNADLPEGEVLVAVEYSSINYKDAMAVTGTGKIIRSFPMVPGIDLAGRVLESQSPQFKPGDAVVLTGWSVGERFWGGYSQRQRVRADWLVPLPEGLSTRDAMAVGTAGFTAMQCVMALQEAGITPHSGEVLVTGAAGGVGSVAVSLLAASGYQVAALVSHPAKPGHAEYLRALGAARVISGEEWTQPPLPLEKQRWAAAIDTVGSKVLARVLAEVNYGGAVAACGLAGGTDLPTTVMPFILRGVRLLGVDSVQCPQARRLQIWQAIAWQLNRDQLAQITREIGLAEVPHYATELMQGRSRGRLVVNVNQ